MDKTTLLAGFESGGLSIIDLKNPSQPVELARFNPQGAAYDAANGGIPFAAGVTQFDASAGCIYVGSQTGLFVLDDTRAGPQCKP
jgi:hypothetical protein